MALDYESKRSLEMGPTGPRNLSAVWLLSLLPERETEGPAEMKMKLHAIFRVWEVDR